MTIELMTMGFNESFLAPFFFNHYQDIDKIHFYLDADTTDDTAEIASKYPNVEISEFSFPDGMDDLIKTDFLNQEYRKLTSDFVMLVDMDEFIYNWQYITGNQPVYFTKLFNVYRHCTEKDLDANLPIREQRRHGYLDPMYIKPNIVRGGIPDFSWGLGIHDCRFNGEHIASWNSPFAANPLTGAHWAMADDFAVDRRVKGRKERQSRSNLEKGLTVQHHHITEESVRQELEAHRNDPEVF